MIPALNPLAGTKIEGTGLPSSMLDFYCKGPDMIIESFVTEFEKYFRLLDNTLRQLDLNEFLKPIESEHNSVAIILKHITGNLISRYTNFLLEDGEKNWRNRDSEFEIMNTDVAVLISNLEIAKSLVLSEVRKLKVENLEEVVSIRNEKMSVVSALTRSLSHFSYHVGQIVFIAKTIKGSKWINQSIPLGKSKEFNSGKI